MSAPSGGPVGPDPERSAARFGFLSRHSFFSRHNPHPHRVRHIQGRVMHRIDFLASGNRRRPPLRTERQARLQRARRLVGRVLAVPASAAQESRAAAASSRRPRRRRTSRVFRGVERGAQRADGQSHVGPKRGSTRRGARLAPDPILGRNRKTRPSDRQVFPPPTAFPAQTFPRSRTSGAGAALSDPADGLVAGRPALAFVGRPRRERVGDQDDPTDGADGPPAARSPPGPVVLRPPAARHQTEPGRRDFCRRRTRDGRRRGGPRRPRRRSGG
ncbi:uncharacterized protein tbata isoform X1 [Syngnathoides biaculeatus]|uniref:uncharacterized protein tbata isoform X1 n=1 Tax=Syngnathoides biaculeatus TaxID=300417 RepID=UPI002ADDE22D|nr:uncharacterized protein tbata isoform X1 [Syngnathoides biaculeatus]